MPLYAQCNKYKDEIAVNDKKNRGLIKHQGERFLGSSVPLYLRDNGHALWRNLDIYYISDIHLEHKILHRFPNDASDKDIKDYIKALATSLFMERIKKPNSDPVILFGGDIGSEFQIVKYFYKCFMAMGKLTRVYAVLGNHEYWPFLSYEKCIDKYKKLFVELGIHFLNGGTTFLIPKGFRQFMITGGTGFAGNNLYFNASNGLYRKAIDPSKEIQLTEKWQQQFKRAVKKAQKNHAVLIVLTHNPPWDWLGNYNKPSNCTFFCGHDHRNNWDRDDERNYYLFANNQVGYDGTKITFKKANLYSRYNPYAHYKDGYYKTDEDEYTSFCEYIGENLQGTKLIHNTLKNDGVMWVIKQSSYYGFFLTTSKGTYICNGGKVRKISKGNDIDFIFVNFFPMITQYLRRLTPYRDLQEQYSKMIKSFGGDGTIHGSIIDIDFYNHIMINPLDGTVSFYYSPVLGIVKTYGDLQLLLHHHCPRLEANLNKGKKHQIRMTHSKNNSPISEFEKLDVKNSPYKMSFKLAPLQRLFDKNVLRDWDMNLLSPKEVRKLDRQ